MSNNFGIQYFDEKGNLSWDNKYAFTRIIGYVDIPLYHSSQLPVSGTITIGGGGKFGKPFCFIVPKLDTKIVYPPRNLYFSPTVKFTIDTIVWTYTKACSAFSELGNDGDLLEGDAGNVKLFYGVYGR